MSLCKNLWLFKKTDFHIFSVLLKPSSCLSHLDSHFPAYVLAFYLTHFCPFTHLSAQTAFWGLYAPWNVEDISALYVICLSCRLMGDIFLKAQCQGKLSLLSIWFVFNVHNPIVVTDHTSHFMLPIDNSADFTVCTNNYTWPMTFNFI